MADRNADLADFPFGQHMIAVIARLRGQVEGHGKTRLPFRQIAPVERVGGCRGRVTRIGPEQPGAIFLRLRHGGFS